MGQDDANATEPTKAVASARDAERATLRTLVTDLAHLFAELLVEGKLDDQGDKE